MTWSYSGDPSASNLDEVRFWSQLTDTNDQRLSNEEITFLGTKESSNREAAAACCEVLATKYSAEADIKAGASGELSIKMSQLSKQFSEMAIKLREESAKLAGPWAASISISEKEAQEDRDDRVKPAFARDQWKSDGLAGGSAVQDWNDRGTK